MKLINKKRLLESYEKWDITTQKHHNFVVCGTVVHNSNSRFVCVDGEMFYGSRTEWKKEYASRPDLTYEQLLERIGDEEKAKSVFEKIQNWKPKRNMWWQVASDTPAIELFCQANPNYCLYGEVLGHNKGFPYDVTPESGLKFAAFDILKPNGMWMAFPEFLETVKTYCIPHVPVIHEAIPFNFDEIVKMAEGLTLAPGATHIREGVVVHPIVERWDEKIGRVKLKVINPSY